MDDVEGKTNIYNSSQEFYYKGKKAGGRLLEEEVESSILFFVFLRWNACGWESFSREGSFMVQEKEFQE